MYTLIILIVAIATCLIPKIISNLSPYLSRVTIHSSPSWLPALAAILFFSAFYIPDIHISNQTTTFQQHFVGGGIYVACLFVYFRKLLNWRLHWLPTLIVLFAWASAFGVANELLEFTLTKLHFAAIGSGDTDWDLLANSLGAFTGYAILCIFKVKP